MKTTKTSTYGYIFNIEHKTQIETKFRYILKTKQVANISIEFSNTHGRNEFMVNVRASECEKCEMEIKKRKEIIMMVGVVHKMTSDLNQMAEFHHNWMYTTHRKEIKIEQDQRRERKRK